MIQSFFSALVASSAVLTAGASTLRTSTVLPNATSVGVEVSPRQLQYACTGISGLCVIGFQADWCKAAWEVSQLQSAIISVQKVLLQLGK